MKTRNFKLILEGPSGCGKSSFLNLLVEKFFWEETIRIKETGEHELEIFLKREAFPSPPPQERKEKTNG